MEEVSTQAVTLLQALLPGFITTMIFYWLAQAPKPSQFERIVQALICSGIIKLIVEGLMMAFLWLGHWWSIGTWSATVETTWSMGLAIAIGLLLAWCAFHDTLYSWARSRGLTSRSSALIAEYEFSFLRYRDRAIVLNLLDGRRLLGFPKTWPSDPLTGHFLIESPHWLVEEEMRPCSGISVILIANSDVQWVEFLDQPEEVA
ncbi:MULTISPECIES: DUF6338 family protein [unclassified Pseudomonas]|uniref:DUF6338 family protein n=1 Tax=unclassified Pseudomonas TaxID=196821 RepID=UPI0014738D0D|nr:MULTISPECIES: DUF6338 family protein [unclassified Pseudomonas]NMX94289.1 hypothetical protein [Pseudomonas sp. WS 5086]NMY48135.1 hypothetical protein [Pseudomonas sp. WS 5027]